MENRLKKESLVIENSNFHCHLRDTFQIGSGRSPFSNQSNRISVSNSRNKQNVNQSKLVRFELKTVLTGQKSPQQKRNIQIVLQGIQINRLTSQLNTIRIRSKENQLKCVNYEKQLKQLKEYCHKMLEQNNQYHVQLQKMNKISERVYHQKEQLKLKLRVSEQKWIKKQQSQQQTNRSSRSSRKYQNQKIKNLKTTNEQRNYQNLQKENNFLKSLLASTEEKLRNEHEKYLSQSIKLNQISEHELMIQGLNKQLSFSMQDNQKLHKLLKQRTSQINKWQKVARQSQNNISIKILQKPQSIQQGKQDKNLKLSEQVLRLTELLYEKYEQLKNWERYFNQFKQKCLVIVEKMSNSNQNENNSSNINALQKQLNEIKFQHAKCSQNYKRKNDELQKLKANYSILNNDLSQINELRTVCQKQQNRIAENLKRMELLKAFNQEYQNKISTERNKNNEIRSSITQKNLNKQNQLQISRILCKVTELESTVSDLNKNYQNLLTRALKQA